jgi:hypothetical protein
MFGLSSPPPQSVQITQEGGGTLGTLSSAVSFGAGQPSGWLVANLSSTTAPAELSIQALTGSLAQGTYLGKVMVLATGRGVAAKEIGVTFVLVDPPVIAVAPTAVTFSTVGGGARPAVQTVSVSNAGGSTLSGLGVAVTYRTGEVGGWLTATLAGTTAPTTLSLQPSAPTIGGAFHATVVVNTTIPEIPSRAVGVTYIVADQQQPTIDASANLIGLGGSSEQMLAQVVTPGMSGPLTEVRFPIACDLGTLIVEIQGVTSGKPNGTVLASQTVATTGLPPFGSDPPSFRSIVFATPTTVSAGNPFTIVLKSPTGTCAVSQGPVGDPYSGGDAFFDARPNPPGVWVSLGARRDLPFQTVVQQ